MASIESIGISGYFGRVKISSHKLNIVSWLKVIEKKQRMVMRINPDNDDDNISLRERPGVSSCAFYPKVPHVF